MLDDQDTGTTVPGQAPAKPARAGAFNRERVLDVEHYTDKLFRFRTTRSPSFRFRNGQFAMIGLEVEGRPLLRAYSMTSAAHDEWLEFFSIKVPDGPLTSRLQHIAVGDEVLIGTKPTGTLVLDNLSPGKRLFLLATGTGFAPFASILRDPETYEAFEQVVLVYGCRQAAELQFATQVVTELRSHEYLAELVEGKLVYYATVTREPYHHNGRITDAIRTGKLVADVGGPALDPASDRVMICGNPNMLKELRAMFAAAGFAEGNSGEAGDFLIERAFVER